MNQYNRYFLVLFEENPFKFSFFRPEKEISLSRPLDIEHAKKLMIENEKIDIPLISKGKFSVIGKLSDIRHYSEHSNLLLRYLQNNRLIYGTIIQSETLYGYSCLPSQFRQAALSGNYMDSNFSKQMKDLLSYDILDDSDNVDIQGINFNKHDFQPVFFAYEVYFKMPEVKSIYKDIDNLYSFIRDNFSDFLQRSNIDNELKNTHFFNINSSLYNNFSNLSDVIIFNDYLVLLNNMHSEKYQAAFMKSMLLQKDKKEKEIIKNYLLSRNIDILNVLLSPVDLNNHVLRDIKRKEYLSLIDNFFA